MYKRMSWQQCTKLYYEYISGVYDELAAILFNAEICFLIFINFFVNLSKFPLLIELVISRMVELKQLLCLFSYSLCYKMEENIIFECIFTLESDKLIS